MTRPKPLTAVLLTVAAMVALNGCHTTVIEPAAQPVSQQDHHDDRHPPPPAHHDDHPQDHR